MTTPSRSRTLTRPRSDAVRNQAKLMEATGEVLRTEPSKASMALIAKKAGLSIATAYRYHSSLEDLLSAYLREVIVTLRDFSHDCPLTKTALFEAVLREWLHRLSTYGPSMVQLRSKVGFLHRLHAGDPVIVTMREVWERPVRAVMRDLGIPESEFDYALFLYNMMFDPREIIDLQEADVTDDQIFERLTSAYYGALKGWAAAAAPRPRLTGGKDLG